MSYKLAIVGGGPSALMAALLLQKKDVEIDLFEASDKLGWTIMRSGNGRCNFSNADLHAHHYLHEHEVAQVFKEHPEQEILNLFEGLGLSYTLEDDRYYPKSLHARSVLNVLLREIVSGNTLRMHTNTRVNKLVRYKTGEGVKPIDDDQYPFTLFDEQNTLIGQADKVIWAAGGGSFKDFACQNQLAHTELTPLLCPIKCTSHVLKGLSGIRAQARVSLSDEKYLTYAQEYGEVLIRSYGLSGIAIFNLSRHLQENSRVIIDFAPDMTFDELCSYLDAIIAQNPNSDYAQLLDGLLHPDLGRRIMELTQDGAEAILFDLEPKRKSAKKLLYPPTNIPVSATDTPSIAALVKNFELPAIGTTQHNSAQVLRGGLELRELNLDTFELKRIPGLYVLGEALDVDGDCGGYNLAWAWMSAKRCAEHF